MSLQRDVHAWMSGPDAGLSSRLLIRCLAFGETPLASLHQVDYPHDASDLARCIRALDRFPFLRERLHAAASLSPEWREIICHWNALESYYREELQCGAFQKTDFALRRILDAASEDASLTADDLLAGFAPAPVRRSAKKALFVIDMREVNDIIAGRSLDAVSYMLKGLQKDYSTPCLECGRKRVVVMDSPYQPTPDKRKCHDCCSKEPAGT